MLWKQGTFLFTETWIYLILDHSFIVLYTKLYLISSWADLRKDKLITWEFFHLACKTSVRLLDWPSMETKAWTWNEFFCPVNSTVLFDPSNCSRQCKSSFYRTCVHKLSVLLHTEDSQQNVERRLNCGYFKHFICLGTL